MVMLKDIKEIVADDAMTEFCYCSDNKLVYRVYNPVTDGWYKYDIPFEETKGGFFFAKEKAIFHLRWIRKAIQTNQFRLEN